MNDDPSRDWDRYCAREEERALAELQEDVAICVRENGFPVYILELVCSSEHIGFYPMNDSDIRWQYDEYSGEHSAKNCEYMEAEIVWVERCEEIDLVATAANVIATILGYLPPRQLKPAWRGLDLNEILGTHTGDLDE